MQAGHCKKEVYSVCRVLCLSNHRHRSTYNFMNDTIWLLYVEISFKCVLFPINEVTKYTAEISCHNCDCLCIAHLFWHEYPPLFCLIHKEDLHSVKSSSSLYLSRWLTITAHLAALEPPLLSIFGNLKNLNDVQCFLIEEKNIKESEP